MGRLNRLPTETNQQIATIRERDMEVENVKIELLKSHPQNPRVGDVKAIAESITANGWWGTVVAQKSTNHVLAGNHRILAAKSLDIKEVPVYWVDVDDDQALKILLADNRTNDLATYDEQILADLLKEITFSTDEGLTGTGYEVGDLDALLTDLTIVDKPEKELIEPVIPPPPITKPGDTIRMGEHLLFCGDTTNPENIKKLLNGETVTLLHADPPYGMGKEKDGIANDNLYREELDKFQLAWWAAWKPVMKENSSMYIWGNPEDLWRLWWKSGLSLDTDLTFRNEIVWDKGSGQGMGSSLFRSYATATERCLFFMMGRTFLSNNTKADYWEGYEPFRVWMNEQLEKVQWTKNHVNRLTETFMAGHWFGKSQFQIINKKDYKTLQNAAQGKAFDIEYTDIFDKFFLEGTTADRSSIERPTFNNEHDLMTDVWEVSRVYGEDRFNHATPKPVDAMMRVLRTSTNPGDTVAVPFAGTAPELIAAERLHRRCVLTELDAGYCDLIIGRWQDHTGQTAQRIQTGSGH